MKRKAAVLSTLIFFGLVFLANSEITRLEKDVDYVNAHVLNSKIPATKDLKDCVKEKPEIKKKNAVRYPIDPEKIYTNAGYLVKLRIFKSIIIPATQQTIYVDTRSFGSGSIVKCRKYKYCVLTAFHVVNKSSVTYFAEPKDGSPAQALELIAGTTTNDAALLRFTDASYIPKSVGAFGNSDALPAGARVCAFGSNSFGNFWVSVGHTYHRVLTPSGEFKKKLELFDRYHNYIIPSDAKLYGGYSGGPLVNEYGKIVAINVSVTAIEWNTVNISIPINEIRKEFKILN